MACVCGKGLVWKKCNSKLRFDKSPNHSVAIVRHAGTHNHCCPPVEKADFFAKQELERKIKSNPRKKPLSLVIGETADNNSITSSSRNISFECL